MMMEKRTSRQVMNDYDKYVMHSFVKSLQPIADEANRKGKYLLQRLRELQPKHKLIGEVRGLGLMVGVELVKDQKLKTPAPSEATKIRELALNKGLLLGHGGVKGNTVRIQPPLVITEEQLEKTVQVFDECLRETR